VKVLLDADVLLDTAIHREPFASDSDRVLRWCQQTPHSAIVAWHSLSNLYYLLRRAQDDGRARGFIADLIRFAAVASGGTQAVRHALSLPVSDFEDALQVVAAIAADVDFIVTRNTRDFARSPLRAITPAKLLCTLGRG
jgi:hypothetical protein